jgi:hypothetical protein
MQNSTANQGKIRHDFSQRIAALQKWIEKKNFRMRRQLLESDRQRDDVMAQLVGPNSSANRVPSASRSKAASPGLSLRPSVSNAHPEELTR